ncbi:ribonuclease H-like domain-containing protein [Tanacetum coccineum]
MHLMLLTFKCDSALYIRRTDWHMDTGAISIPVTNTSHSIIPSIHRPLHLHNVLVTPNIIKNLIFVRQFTRNNNCIIEFDAFGLSVKDFLTRHILLRCDSSDSLHNDFDMTDLGVLNYFLGISTTLTPTFLFLSQKKYALQLLERAHMVNCNPSQTPVDTSPKLDLSYAVQRICLYMHNLREPHFAALKRILRYVQGTVDFVPSLNDSYPTTSPVGYTDADWVAKRQHTLSRSSAKAEYRGVANIVARQLGFAIYFVSYIILYRLPPLFTEITLVSFICLPTLFNINGRNILRSTFILSVIWLPMAKLELFMYLLVISMPDIFTNGLPSALFADFRSSLSVRPPPAQTAGGVLVDVFK